MSSRRAGDPPYGTDLTLVAGDTAISVPHACGEKPFQDSRPRIEASGCRRVHMRLLGRRDGSRDIKTLITALTEFEHNEEAEAERVA